jgi:hypothetical protein
MIGWFGWWLLRRVYPAGSDVTAEMLDALDAVMAMELDLLRRGGRRP